MRLGLSFASPRAFDADDRRFITAVAQQCAQALDRAQLHEATAAAERYSRLLAESLPQLIWTTRADGAVEYANARFLEFVGLTLPELRASHWGNIAQGLGGGRIADPPKLTAPSRTVVP